MREQTMENENQKFDEIPVKVPKIHTQAGNDIAQLNKTPGTDYEGPETKVVISAHRALWEKIPEKLFKFYCISESSFKSLKNQNLWMSKPSLFNDPFDKGPYYDEKVVHAYLEKIKKDKRSIWDKLKTFLKITDDTPSNTQLIGIINEVIAKWTKISCFSSVVNEPLLWSHYAEGHTGFALAFPTEKIKQLMAQRIVKYEKLQQPYLDLLPVSYTYHNRKRFDATGCIMEFLANYVEQRETIHYKDVLKLASCFLYKSFSWHYEQEWRLIYYTNNEKWTESNGVPLSWKPFLIPTEIFLGCNMKPSVKDQIDDIIREINIDRAKKGDNTPILEKIVLSLDNVHSTGTYSLKYKK